MHLQKICYIVHAIFVGDPDASLFVVMCSHVLRMNFRERSLPLLQWCTTVLNGLKTSHKEQYQLAVRLALV